jgi:hypothetical protein
MEFFFLKRKVAFCSFIGMKKAHFRKTSHGQGRIKARLSLAAGLPLPSLCPLKFRRDPHPPSHRQGLSLPSL